MSKILECVSCGTCYESPAAFPVEGRKVRCAKCGEVWHAIAKEPDEEPSPIPDLEDEEDELVFREEEAESEAETPEEDAPDDSETVEAQQEPEESIEEQPSEEEDAQEPVEAASDDVEATEDGDDAPSAEAGEPEDEPDVDDDAPIRNPPELIDPVSDPPPGAPARSSMMARLSNGMDGVTLGWVALVLLFAGIFYSAYEARVAVVRAIPGTAWAYDKIGIAVNVRGLGFGPVAYHWAVEAGRPVLEVEGEIRNLTNATLTVPTVVFALRNSVDVEVYQWAADIREDPLPGGERTLFLARIPSPPKSIGSVQVRFARSR